METSNELTDNLEDYLKGNCSIRQLEEWTVPRLPQFLSNVDSLDGRIAGAIELSLSEVADGLRTERSAKMSLRKYLKRQRELFAMVNFEPPEEETYSSNPSGPELMFQQLIWESNQHGGQIPTSGACNEG